MPLRANYSPVLALKFNGYLPPENHFEANKSRGKPPNNTASEDSQDTPGTLTLAGKLGFAFTRTWWLVVFQSVKLLVADFLPLVGLGFGLLAGSGWLLECSVACFGAIVGGFSIVVGDCGHWRREEEAERDGIKDVWWGVDDGLCYKKIW